MKFVALFAILATFPAFASDHIDGPVTQKHRVADLTDLYAYPTPGKAGSLTVVLNTYPVVPLSGHFSEKVSYNLIFRRASVKGSGARAFVETNDEVKITCSFKTPEVTADHVATCKGSNGIVAQSKFNVITAKQEGDDFRLFAGMRSDPFFFSGFAAYMASKKGVIFPNLVRKFLPFSDIMKHANVLSIIMDIDVNKLFAENPPAVIALAAESIAKDTPTSAERRMDRVGRPEITNVSMVDHKGDADIRDKFNLDQPFNVAAANQESYKARLAKNIRFYDSIDEKQDWNDADRDGLADVLANDFLVVDVSKPCDKDAFFDIEKSMIRHSAYETCGGRKPNDDIMDKLFSMYIGGIEGKRISDHIDHPYHPTSDVFPYLAEPETGFAARAKAVLGYTFGNDMN